VTDQLNQLVARGMIVNDPEAATHYLNHIGYYRLSGYTRPFLKDPSGLGAPTFKPNSTFEDVLDRYVFDRKLRLLAMDAIERIEVSIRSAFSNAIATRHGSHWYQNDNLFSQSLSHIEYLQDLKHQIGHGPENRHRRDIYVEHYYEKYSSPDMPPCWMVFESVSFGTISQTYKNLAHPEFNFICKPLGLNHAVLISWLHSLSYLRNICAHHGRLWNRECRIKPLAANAYKADLSPNTRIYAQLVVMQVLLKKIVPDNHWALRLEELLDAHPNVPLSSMGFPIGWSSRLIWQSV
jgi:abortive infection bacteriophage resistance protein